MFGKMELHTTSSKDAANWKIIAPIAFIGFLVCGAALLQCAFWSLGAQAYLHCTLAGLIAAASLFLSRLSWQRFRWAQHELGRQNEVVPMHKLPEQHK